MASENIKYSGFNFKAHVNFCVEDYGTRLREIECLNKYRESIFLWTDYAIFLTWQFSPNWTLDST